MLAESDRFGAKSIYTELDLRRLSAERRRMTSFETDSHGYEKIAFHLDIHETELTRYFDPAPFVPSGMADREKRCEEILMMQAVGLKKRLEHTGCRHAVDRYFRRAGFHAGTAGDGEGVAICWTFPRNAITCSDHALLWNNRPYLSRMPVELTQDAWSRSL